MTKLEKFLAIAFLSGVIVLLGGVYYAQYCFTRMWPEGFTGPAAAEAADTKYTCGMHPMIVVDEPGTCPICGMDLTPLKAGVGEGGATEKPQGERKIKYWQAPMDPTYIRDEPGKSPMGMDLIPVYEDEAPGGSIISIDPVTAQNMGVRTASVVRRDLSRTVRTVGLVAYEEPRQYSINSKIGGWIEKLHVNETGQFVKKGQPLLEIYSPELVSAQEEFLLALNNKTNLENSTFPEIAEGARRLYQSSRKRLKLWDISEGQINRLERTRRVEKNLVLYAPYNGIVTMKMAYEGMHTKSGMELFKISDISRVWIYADIYEYELPWVKEGQEAEIILPFVGEKSLKAKVTYLYPYVEPKTRTVKARLELDNPGFELKPDMYVNIRLKTQKVEGALSIPAEAVLHSGEKTTVFVALEDGKFEPREVKIGLQDQDGNTQVIQGLLEGEQVVTSAQFMLDSESKLREAIQKMLEPKKEKPTAAENESMEGLFGEEGKDGKKEELDDLFK